MDDYRPRLKVWAASAGAAFGAGIGSGVSASEAQDMAALVAEAFSLSLSEAGMRGMVVLVSIVISTITAAVGAFVAGYLKTEREGAWR